MAANKIERMSYNMKVGKLNQIKSSMFTCCPISKIIGLPGTAVNPILGIICPMLIRLQPIKFLFFFVHFVM